MTPQDVGRILDGISFRRSHIHSAAKASFSCQSESSTLAQFKGGEGTCRHEWQVDVTIVAWGNTVAIAAGAAEKAGVSADIDIDLCSSMPWDKDTILHSLTKTGRLVIVQEDMATVVSALLSCFPSLEPKHFYKLAATPRVISRLIRLFRSVPTWNFRCFQARNWSFSF